jgi:hypothetical protein
MDANQRALHVTRDCTLQSTTNLAPVVIAGQNTVTNPISGAQRFYRLKQ